METIGYLSSALIGISLGLIGGGGSILTVPVMVYLFGVNPLLATSYSLFIVGSTSMVGAYKNFKNGLINVNTAMLFGASSIITVFITRKFIITAIPEHLFVIGKLEVTAGIMTMILFAILMLLAAIAMIRKQKAKSIPTQPVQLNLFKLLVYGVGIGLATGILGAGGGFLLIPALVLLVGLPMKEAVGTSLLIIALNSLIGFAVDLGHFNIDWIFLLKVTLIAMAGMLIGVQMSRHIDHKKLKTGFGWFVLLMGSYILIKELFLSR